jgi:hypothetical protein
MPGGGGIGLPDSEAGGPGGGGMGLPDDEVGAPVVGPPARGVSPAGGEAGGRGPPAGGGAGRPAGGAAGRGWRGAALRSAGRAGRGGAGGADGPADAAGRAAPGSSWRGGRGGCSLPEDVTSRPGGAGGTGRPAVRCGGAAGGVAGRGFQPSVAGWPAPASRDAGAGLAARAGPASAAAGRSPRPDAGAAGALVAAGDWALAALVLGLALPPDVDGVPAPSRAAPPLAGFGSAGCSARTRPSRSARLRTRSACASSMPEECVLTPMPSALDRSRVSLFVRPSSLASSCTRIFAAKVVSDQPFVFSRTRCAHLMVRIAALHPRADRCPATNSDRVSPVLQRFPGRLPPVRNARANAPRRTACARHASSVARQSHAPRPGSVRPSTCDPSLPRTKRTSSDCGALRRQPTQVRSGSAAALPVVTRLALGGRVAL